MLLAGLVTWPGCGVLKKGGTDTADGGTASPSAIASLTSTATGTNTAPPTTAPTATTVAPAVDSRPDERLGAICTRSGRCASGLACISTVDGQKGTGRCQRPCPKFDNTKCERGDECIGDGIDLGSGRQTAFCIRTPPEVPESRPARSCVFGRLPVTLSGAKLCLAACTKDGDCVGGDVCKDVELDDGKGSRGKACAPRSRLK